MLRGVSQCAPLCAVSLIHGLARLAGDLAGRIVVQFLANNDPSSLCVRPPFPFLFVVVCSPPLDCLQ